MFFKTNKFRMFIIEFIFLTILVLPIPVLAANKLYHCDYDLNTGIEDTNGKKLTLPFKIIVYDNDTLEFKNNNKVLSSADSYFSLSNGMSYGSVKLNINIKVDDMKESGLDYCPDLNLDISKAYMEYFTLKVGNAGTLEGAVYTTTGGEPQYATGSFDSNKLSINKSCTFYSSSNNELQLDYGFKLILNMYNTGTKEMCIDVNVNGVDKACTNVTTDNGGHTVYNDHYRNYTFIIEKDQASGIFIQKNFSDLNYNNFTCPTDLYVYLANEYDYFFTSDKNKAYAESNHVVKLSTEEVTNKEQSLAEKCEIIPEVILNYIKDALRLLRWGALALMIILGILDFVKAAAADDQDALKKAWQKFIKRLIAVIILFLLPILLELILYLAGLSGFVECYPSTNF